MVRSRRKLFDPGRRVGRDGCRKVEADFVPGDQELIVQLGDGIIILAGCSHAGIINTINCAKKITGTEHVIASSWLPWIA